MSSTNRGYSRHASDYYVTPTAPIKEFLSEWLSDELEAGQWIADRPDKAKWLDPCAGGDELHEMSYPQVIQDAFEPDYLVAMDIRADSHASVTGDYLLTESMGYDVIITNPPFYLAREIVQKALQDVNDGGYVIMLLRLNFLGSASRFSFWEKYRAKRIYVHHKRMSFTDNNKTDSIEYAHFVWQKGYDGPTTIKVI